MQVLCNTSIQVDYSGGEAHAMQQKEQLEESMYRRISNVYADDAAVCVDVQMDRQLGSKEKLYTSSDLNPTRPSVPLADQVATVKTLKNIFFRQK